MGLIYNIWNLIMFDCDTYFSKVGLWYYILGELLVYEDGVGLWNNIIDNTKNYDGLYCQ